MHYVCKHTVVLFPLHSLCLHTVTHSVCYRVCINSWDINATRIYEGECMIDAATATVC